MRVTLRRQEVIDQTKAMEAQLDRVRGEMGSLASQIEQWDQQVRDLGDLVRKSRAPTEALIN